MSNDVYPSLPGMRWGVVRAPRFKTQIDETASGIEYRQRLMLYPRRRYVMQYEFLRDRNATDELRTLVGFFCDHGGSFDSWLFNDPDDNTATNQVFGVGDGVTNKFQLVRSFGGYVEPVYDLNGAPTIYVDGVLKSTGYSVSSSGAVTFTAAPASNSLISWTGSYYWRCRFTHDEQEFEKFLAQLWQTGKVEFITDKPRA